MGDIGILHRIEHPSFIEYLVRGEPSHEEANLLALVNRVFMQYRTPVEANPDGATLQELVLGDDEVMKSILRDAEWAFEQVKRKPVWAATLSGGKDSAATVCLAIEYLKRNPDVRPKLVILHADTLMEAPPMEEFARHLMATMAAECKAHGIERHIVTTEPPLEDDFWVLTLGHGYPPFNHGFRPCTTRLKTKPNANALVELVQTWTPADQKPGDAIALLLGVRMDESDHRREGLKKVCNLTDGECGQILDAPEHIPGDVVTVAPIINAKTCKVWDLNMFILSELGWPTATLAEIYGDEVVRFGCWMCSLVERVKDVENLMQIEEHAWMEHLWRFRADYLREAAMDENRLFMSLEEKKATSPNWKERKIDGKETKGIKRGITLAFRRRWLDRLLELQATVGRQLIRPEAEQRIRELWEIEATTGKRGKSGRAAGKEAV